MLSTIPGNITTLFVGFSLYFSSLRTAIDVFVLPESDFGFTILCPDGTVVNYTVYLPFTQLHFAAFDNSPQPSSPWEASLSPTCKGPMLDAWADFSIASSRASTPLLQLLYAVNTQALNKTKTEQILLNSTVPVLAEFWQSRKRRQAQLSP
jgi:hypothetical protein